MEKKDIVLVYPPLMGSERYGELAAGGNYGAPMGVCVLASCMRKLGLSVAIVDAEILQIDAIRASRLVLEHSPRFVGISATTTTIHNSAELAERIKAESPETTIIIGGAHVTVAPEDTLTRFPHFDYGVLREGESALYEVMEAHGNRKPLSEILGIIYRENGGLKQTPHRPYIENLDTVPFPAWDLLPHLPKYYRSPAHSYIRLPSGSLVTTRGCPGRCTFCSQWNIYQRVFRAHGAEYVFEMMKILQVDYGIRDVYFQDDTFTVSRDRIMELCEMLIREKWKQVWSCQSRVNIVDLEMLRMMKRAKCWQIAYGVESGSQEILDSLKKGITLEQTEQALKWTKRAGIRTRGFFMIGVPHETGETIKQTIAFSKRIALDDLHVGLFTPYPGAEIYNDAMKYGKFDNDWRKMNGWFVVFVPHGLTEGELVRWQKVMFREFYIRPKIIFSYLRMLNNRAQLKRFITGVFTLLNFLVKKKPRNASFRSFAGEVERKNERENT